jgi:hypothetical protein
VSALPALPLLTVNWALLPFALVAVSMIGVTAFVLTHLLPRDRTAPLLSTMTIGVAALGGGTVLLLALLYVFIDPDGTTAWTWVLLAFNFMMMGPAGLWFVSVMLFRDRTIDRVGWTWPVVLALVIVGSEVLMGILFATASVGAATGVIAALAGGLTSIWFDWSMAAVMAVLVVWLPLRGLVRGTLASLTAAAVLAPWVTATPGAGVVGMALLMGAVLGLLYRYLSSGRAVAPDEVRTLTGLGVAFAAMVAAQAVVVLAPASPSAALAYGTIMALVMATEVASVGHHTLRPTEIDRPFAWSGRPERAIGVAGPAREH